MPKFPNGKGQKDQLKHDPLAVQLQKDKFVVEKKEKKQNRRHQLTEDEQTVDAKTSAKLLSLAKLQQREVELEDNGGASEVSKGGSKIFEALSEEAFSDVSEDNEEEVNFAKDAEYNPDAPDNLDFYGDDLDIDESDAALIEKYFTNNSGATKNLASLVMSKIEQAEDEQRVDEGRAVNRTLPDANPKLIEVYTRVGMLLSRFKSGKLPKAFKIIPSLPNWDEILYLTNPEGWTPNAMFMATRLFCSNLNPKQAQKFYQYVLLDAVRFDIQANRKLNYHHYMALKRAIYKPAAFFKGIVLPLCQSGTCTLREAALIGSIMVKVSIPMLHTAAALLKLAELEYAGPISLFIRILLDKKYALPYKVIDALVFHFLRFANDSRQLPVLWHQSLLVFAQRYKEDLVPEQKDALRDLTRAQFHPDISPEVRRELDSSICRGEVSQVEMFFD